MKLLLERGANVFLHTEAGLNGTALHFAAGNGHYDCVRYLITFKWYQDDAGFFTLIKKSISLYWKSNNILLKGACKCAKPRGIS